MIETQERTIEKGLIGYLLAEYPDPALLNRMSSEWFTEASARRIFAWMYDRHQNNEPADLLLAIRDLSKEDAHYSNAALLLYQDTGLEVSGVRDQYVRELKKTWIDRQLSGLALNGHGDEDRQRMKELLDESQHLEQASWKTSAEAMPAVLRDIEARMNADPVMPTGYQALDALTDGFHPGELWTIGAYTSVGKTVCLTSMMHRLLSRHLRILYLTTEMHYVEYIKTRLLPVFSGVHSEALRKHRLTTAEWESVKKGAAFLAEMPLIVSDLATPSLSDLVLAVKATKPVALFVDHLHRCILPSADSKNDALNEFMRGLKSLARDENLPVIAAAQFNRASQASTEPSMTHLRDSGSLEMESDVVMLLNRRRGKNMMTGKTEVTDVVEVSLAKNRHGPCGTFNLRLSTEEMLLVEDPSQ